MKSWGGSWYIWGMTNRLPAKSLEGRRIRILHSPTTVDGATGVVRNVNTQSGDVAIALEAGGEVTVNWGNGDRWMVIPDTVPQHPATV